MRGKKFTVKQQFAEGFEPDRVAKAQALVDRLGACAAALTLGLQPELPALEAALKAVET